MNKYILLRRLVSQSNSQPMIQLIRDEIFHVFIRLFDNKVEKIRTSVSSEHVTSNLILFIGMILQLCLHINKYYNPNSCNAFLILILSHVYCHFKSLIEISTFYSSFTHRSIQFFSCLWHRTSMPQIKIMPHQILNMSAD